MKTITLIFLVMTIEMALGQNESATTIRSTFNRETNVSINIQAEPEVVWALLTNASDYPRWNSTIISIEGEISLGAKIRLKSKLDEKRTFKLKVKEFENSKRLVWGDGKGSRIYTLEQESGGTLFRMSEKIGGLMFPMYAKYIPSFDESFDQFAKDLKNEAVKISTTN